MANRPRVSALLVFFALMRTAPQAQAQPVSVALERSRGILTDRISSVLLPVWKTVERIALARDKAGRALHPTLNNLWRWAEQSGTLIHVEISDKDPENPNHAGGLDVEADGPESRPSGTIWLFVSVIDRTETPLENRRGSVRFRGLGRNERYAEVAGHELAHAFSILGGGRLLSAQRELKELGKKR
jgi:hypothetical protein